VFCQRDPCNCGEQARIDADTQIILAALSRVREETAEENIPRTYRRLPWLGGKGVIYGVFGTSSNSYADRLEERITQLEGALREIAGLGARYSHNSDIALAAVRRARAVLTTEGGKGQTFRQHERTCPAYGNYQPPYEECDCGAEGGKGE
jgi:hypothetical protein